MEFGPVTLLFLLVVFAAGTAAMLLMMGKWLDLTGYKYKMETQRNAMNFAQLIVSNSPIVEGNGQPNKLILDEREFWKLNEYSDYRQSPDPAADDWRIEWENYTDFLDYDHDLKIIAFDPGLDGIYGTDDDDEHDWELHNIIFKAESECYPKRIVGVIDLPVLVNMSGNYRPGVVIVNLTRTPLSELSFWLSQAFIRAAWDDYWMLYPDTTTYTVYIPLDPQITGVSINKDMKRVCMSVDATIACKNFIIKEKTYPSDEDITFELNGNLVHTGRCLNLEISVESGKVSVLYLPM